MQHNNGEGNKELASPSTTFEKIVSQEELRDLGREVIGFSFSAQQAFITPRPVNFYDTPKLIGPTADTSIPDQLDYTSQ